MPKQNVCRFSRLAFCLGLVFLLFADGATAHSDQPHAESTLVLRNARIHTLSSAGTLVGSVVIRDGKITAVGKDVTVPEGATVIDLTGHTLVPGLIDSRSSLWLTEAAVREGNSRGALNVMDGVNPWQEDWREVSQQGVTAVYVQPASRGSLGGIGAVLRVAPAVGKQELVISSDAGLQAAIGITGSTSRDRLSQFNKLKTAIKKARDAQKKSESDESGESSDDKKGERSTTGSNAAQGSTSQRQSGSLPVPDKTTDVLKRVVTGEIAIRIEAHHSDAIRWVLELADEYDIQVVIEGASHPGNALQQLQHSTLPVNAGPLMETSAAPGYRSKARWDWLSGLADGNRHWSISTWSTRPRQSRLLRVNAATAVAHGVDATEVLKSITIYPARMLGVDDSIGSLEVGKSADIAVFAGDPLDPSAPTRLVLSRGQITWQADSAIGKTETLAAIDLPGSLPDAYVVKTSRLWQNGSFQPGEISVRDGKIVAVGESVPNDGTLEVVDIHDAVVTPGLVVAHTYLDQRAALGDTSQSDRSHVSAVDAFDPETNGATAMINGGFVHLAFAPDASSTLCGAVGHIRLGAGDFVIDPVVAGKIAFVESARNTSHYPSSLNGQLTLLRSTLKSEFAATNMYVSAAMERSLMARKQANIQAVVNRRHRAIFQVDTELECEKALQVIKNHHLAATLIVTSTYPGMLNEMKEADVSLVVRAFDGNELGIVIEDLVQAANAGIPIAFAGDSPERIRMTASQLVASGMSVNVAMNALTSAAASSAGLKNGTGGFLPGQPADIVIWSGSPLNLGANPIGVVVDGKLKQEGKQ